MQYIYTSLAVVDYNFIYTRQTILDYERHDNIHNYTQYTQIYTQFYVHQQNKNVHFKETMTRFGFDTTCIYRYLHNVDTRGRVHGVPMGGAHDAFLRE